MKSKLKTSLNKIEKTIRNKKYESAIGINRAGKIVGKSKGDSHNTESFTVKHPRDTIVVHNHPPVYIGNIRMGLAPSPADIFNANVGNLRGIRVVEQNYTHTFIPNRENQNTKDIIPLSYYEKAYDSALERIQATWQNKVNNGQMTLKYYYNNLQYQTVKDTSKMLGFKYFITKIKPINDNLWKYPIEVIPPQELPYWLSPYAINLYLKKWETAVKKYPELKKVKGRLVK